MIRYNYRSNLSRSRSPFSSDPMVTAVFKIADFNKISSNRRQEKHFKHLFSVLKLQCTFHFWKKFKQGCVVIKGRQAERMPLFPKFCCLYHNWSYICILNCSTNWHYLESAKGCQSQLNKHNSKRIPF